MTLDEECAAAPVYEVVPSHPLPLLDLSRSLGGELCAFLAWVVRRSSSRVAMAMPTMRPEPGRLHRLLQDADAPVEKLWLYRAMLCAFGLGTLISAIACFVPQTAGVVCAVMGLTLALPFGIVSLAFLRFDVLRLLLTTYDCWFYSLVNTVGAVLLAHSFGDARACVAAIVWLGNIHTVLIDANTRFVCYLNLVSIAVAVLNVAVMIAMETRAIDAWHARAFRLRAQRTHDHTTDDGVVATNNLISNALTTMSIIVLRNAYRRHRELTQQFKIGCPMLRCINYRCRVQLVPADHKRLAQIAALTATESIYYSPDCSKAFPLAQMHYVRFQGVFDSAHTFFPVRLVPLVWSRAKQTAFLAVGAAGLALTAAVFGVYPGPLVIPCGIAGLCCTMVFMGFTLGLFHRTCLRAIVFSFDYAFLSLQLSFGLWCAATLFDWDARSIALASMWLWLHWVLTIDALTPLMKQKIGVPIKQLLVPVLLLFLAAQIVVAVELAWRNRWALTDRVVFSLLGRIDVRLLPFFVSRLVMTFLWSCRLLWRVSTSGDSDGIVQLGRVAFRYTTTYVHRDPAIDGEKKKTKPTKSAPSVAATAVASASTWAQVAPMTPVS